MDRPITRTDPLNRQESYVYDPNGNLLSLTDALNHATNWTYDNMDRVATRTDPLQRKSSYTYDLNGNLASKTNRTGQVTSLTYDALNRLKLVGHNTVVNGGNTTYESTTAYAYDAGDRITQMVDSARGLDHGSILQPRPADDRNDCSGFNHLRL
jgi:YD repeat-containing protein